MNIDNIEKAIDLKNEIKKNEANLKALVLTGDKSSHITIGFPLDRQNYTKELLLSKVEKNTVICMMIARHKEKIKELAEEIKEL